MSLSSIFISIATAAIVNLVIVAYLTLFQLRQISNFIGRWEAP
jgi:hypothetical protein